MDIENATIVVEGKRWEKDLPELDDLEVLVAPWDNKQFERVLTKKVRALPPGLRPDGVAEPGAYYRCVGEAILEAILFDWKNFKVGGVEQPYSKDFAKPYLTDQRYKPFRDGIVTAAQRVRQSAATEEKALEGNSSSTSAGPGSGLATPTA